MIINIPNINGKIGGITYVQCCFRQHRFQLIMIKMKVRSSILRIVIVYLLSYEVPLPIHVFLVLSLLLARFYCGLFRVSINQGVLSIL